MGRAEIAQAEMWRGLEALRQCRGDARFANARLAGDQDDLPIARFGARPAAQQQVDFLVAADQRAQRRSAQGFEPTGNVGEGNLTVSDNVLQILRRNTGGRYRVILQRYFYDSKELEYIPKNPSLSNKRKLKISCQARTSNGTHDLFFTLKRRDDGEVFERTESTIVTKEWRNLIHFVRVDAIDDVLLWIDDQGVTTPDTVLYIRNLSFTETLN